MGLIEESNANLRKYLIENTRKGIFYNMNLPNIDKKDHEIKGGSSFFKSYTDYAERFLQEFDDRQYIVLLQDGSSFQYKCVFTGSKKKEIIEKISMAYLPVVENGKWKNDYIRYDYESGIGNFFHNQSHLHIGLDSSIRIPVDKLFSFEEFCSLIFYLYYNEYFNKLYNNSKMIKSAYAKGSHLSSKLEKYIYFSARNIDLSYLKG